MPTASGPVPAVAQPTKRGEIFVLDRATGVPVTRVEERRVPIEGAASSERVSPTQPFRSEEHTSELQSLMRISYAVFCLKKKKYEINKGTIRIKLDVHHYDSRHITNHTATSTINRQDHNTEL